MATMLEGLAVVAAVFDWLKADSGAGGVFTLAGGRLYRDQIPQGVVGIAVVVTLVSSTPTNTLGGLRVFERTVIDIAVIGAAGLDYSAANPLAKRVDVVIQNKSGTKSGVNVVELVKEQTTAFIENDSGKSYPHIVQTYATPSHAT